MTTRTQAEAEALRRQMAGEDDAHPSGHRIRTGEIQDLSRIEVPHAFEKEVLRQIDDMRRRIANEDRIYMRVSGARAAIKALLDSGVDLGPELGPFLRDWVRHGGMQELRVYGFRIVPPPDGEGYD